MPKHTHSLDPRANLAHCSFLQAQPTLAYIPLLTLLTSPEVRLRLLIFCLSVLSYFPTPLPHN